MADLGSRENRSDDYSLSSDCLKSVLSNFKPVTFDAMASSTNTICAKFYSKLPSLNSCGVDLFSQSLDCSEILFCVLKACKKKTGFIIQPKRRIL